MHLRPSAALRSTGRGPKGTILPWVPRNEHGSIMHVNWACHQPSTSQLRLLRLCHFAQVLPSAHTPAEGRKGQYCRGCPERTQLTTGRDPALPLRSSAALCAGTGRGPPGTILPCLPRSEHWSRPSSLASDNARRTGHNTSLARRRCVCCGLCHVAQVLPSAHTPADGRQGQYFRGCCA